MKHELKIEINGQSKTVGITVGKYLKDQAVFQIKLDDRAFIIYKNPADVWRSNAEEKVTADELQQIGRAIDENL